MGMRSLQSIFLDPPLVHVLSRKKRSKSNSSDPSRRENTGTRNKNTLGFENIYLLRINYIEHIINGGRTPVCRQDETRITSNWILVRELKWTLWTTRVYFRLIVFGEQFRKTASNPISGLSPHLKCALAGVRPPNGKNAISMSRHRVFADRDPSSGHETRTTSAAVRILQIRVKNKHT